MGYRINKPVYQPRLPDDDLVMVIELLKEQDKLKRQLAALSVQAIAEKFDVAQSTIYLIKRNMYDRVK